MQPMPPSRGDATQRGFNRNCLKGQVALFIPQDSLWRKRETQQGKLGRGGYWLILFVVETVAAFSANFQKRVAPFQLQTPKSKSGRL
jgi:hypothetical protein